MRQQFESAKALAQLRRILAYAAAGVGGLACIATRHGDLVEHVAHDDGIADAADVARWGAVVCANFALRENDHVSRALGEVTAHATPIGGGYLLALVAPRIVPSAIAVHRLRRARPLLARMLRGNTPPPSSSRRYLA